jgi:hypothetical protein
MPVFGPLTNSLVLSTTFTDVGSIMSVEELSPLPGAVSWTGKAFTYFIHTVDRSLVSNEGEVPPVGYLLLYPSYLCMIIVDGLVFTSLCYILVLYARC